MSLILGILSIVCFGFLAGIPAIILGALALNKIGKSGGRLTGHGLAIGGLVTGIVGSLLGCLILPAMLLPAVQQVREAARRTDSSGRLREIGIALHNHHDLHQRLPAAGVADGDPADGRALSWRVHILPFLEQNHLYDQFRLDEPWDSPHNLTLVDQMPEVFRSPNYAGDPGKTIYLAVVRRSTNEPGPSTVFGDGTRSSKFRDIEDGLSWTILVVEADLEEAAIWTCPDDWEFDPANPRRGLSNLRPNGFLAMFADSSVQLISDQVDDDTLRKLFLGDDGEVIDNW